MADKTRVPVKAWAEKAGVNTTYFIDGVELVGPGGTIPLTQLADYTRGDLIVGGAAGWQSYALGDQYAVITSDGTDAIWSGFLLSGTTGGRTALAVTNTKVLTLTATDSYNLTIPKTGTAATGTGTAGRIAEWVTDANTLQASTLIKSGAGVLTLNSAATATLTAAITAGKTLTLTAVDDYNITFPITGTAAIGAGTLTAATANDVTVDAHLHAITATADGDTNANTLLKSGAAGDLQVDRLGVGAAVIAASGTICLPDAGYIGNGSAAARLVFDSSGATDYVNVTGCNFGVASAAPVTRMDIGGSSAAMAGVISAEGLGIHITTAATIALGLENVQTSSSVEGVGVALYCNDGAAMANGDRLGFFLFGGSSSASALRNAAGVFAFAAENWVDASAYGSLLRFETTLIGATTRSEAMRISGSKNLLLGTTTDGMTASGSMAIAQDLAHRGSYAGFFNTAPIVKPTASGSRAGNAALASLLTALANLGLITDSTTAS